MAILLIGYDVEVCDPASEVTKTFMRIAPPLHSELGASCSFFICGKTLENNVRELQQVKEKWGQFIDFEQHTYSHLLLKTVVIDNGKNLKVIKGGTLEEIRWEVERTSELLQRYLGVACLGLTGPWGYYRGLMDRPDVLEILYLLGIRFTRTYARNERDYQPVSFEVQPFWYELQGFPEILECPVQWWQDCIWRNLYGWRNKKEYLKQLKGNIDYIVEHNLVWGYVQHDWSSIKEDPEMTIIRELVEYALDRNVRIMSYYDYYQEEVKKRSLALEGKRGELTTKDVGLVVSDGKARSFDLLKKS